MNKKQSLGIKMSVVALVILGIVMLCPSVNTAQAETANNICSVGKSSVSVAINARIDLEITPSTVGTLNYATTNLAISTSQSNGFRVLVSSNNSALKRPSHPEEAGITSITTTTTLSNLPTNTWGMYFGANTPTASSVFLPITTSQTELIHNEVANASGTYKFALAARADTSLPAGYYSNDLIFSVIAGAPAITSLADATYMQDVTPEICSNSDLEVSYTLIDKRDDKPYKVAKLKDGNCWMQEDLKLSLSISTPLTSENSNIPPNEDGSTRSWTPTSNTNDGLINATGATDNGRSWLVNGRYYYQYSALVAGTNPKYDDVVTKSICPQSWELPTFVNSVEHGDYYGLMNIYSSTSLNNPLLGFVATGAVNTDRGAIGESQGMLVWSGTTETSNNVRILYALYFPVVGGTATTFDTLPKAYGAVARCVAIKAK